MRRLIIICMLILLFATSVGAVKEMKLLAVSQSADGELQGSVAHLSVELIPGSGRIFIDTYPLTKIDTQVSTRIAKEIACQFAGADCRGYNFIYTIRSGSPTIGGPSAGAAIAALTVAALEDLPVDDGVTVTGTIGSGGFVGPVGGVLQKVQAASDADIHTVLIPDGERFALNISSIDENVTLNASQDNLSRIDLVAYAGERDLHVVEVYSLSQVVQELTGKQYDLLNSTPYSPGYYRTIMGELAEDLCSEAETLRSQITADMVQTAEERFNGTNISALMAYGDLLMNNSKDAIHVNLSYAAASYCYGAGLQYSHVFWLSQDLSVAEQALNDSRQTLRAYDVPAVNTITDLQTSMLVRERIREAERYFDVAEEALAVNKTRIALQNLAYGRQRFMSATSWANFFGIPGDTYAIPKRALERGCALRTQEAQERQQYVQFYFPATDDAELDEAFRQQQLGNDVLCIFYASKAKAYYDVLVSAIGTDESTRTQVQHRIDIARHKINEQIDEGIFPIAAYSYLEYAESLADSDTFSSLLYAQYGIELADIQIYIDGDETNGTSISYTTFLLDDPLRIFVLGIALGMILSSLTIKLERRLRKRWKKSR